MMIQRQRTSLLALVLIGAVLTSVANESRAESDDPLRVFDRDNLVAWCVVPFDASKRGPVERARMLNELGITRLAYDWRKKDEPDFDAELEALAAHGIELQAFWYYLTTLEPEQDPTLAKVFDLLRRHDARTQVWMTIHPETIEALAEEERMDAATKAVGYLCDEAGKIGCTVGLYNHGGWFGDIDHQMQMLARLRERGRDNVGLVYNLHHAHHEVDRFAETLDRIKGDLVCLNLNGMAAGGPKILPIGGGTDDGVWLRTIIDSSYAGPIGVLDHRDELDAAESLRENLAGLDALLDEYERATGRD